MKKPIYFEEMRTSLYPTGLLHAFGVNGKIAGSVFALGEMEDVIGVLHAPQGCGYHYRFSARRRHYPYFQLISSEIGEDDIVHGGAHQLYDTVVDTWHRYRPKLIVIIPSPISDVVADDLEAVARRARADGINAIAIESEAFSHPDREAGNKRLAETAKQKFGQGKGVPFDTKGCGFTEALTTVVDQVMEPAEPIPRTVNIETIAWGDFGFLLIPEVEATLNRAGITVNAFFPSTDHDAIVRMPQGALNIVRRVKWARAMKQRFGTPFLQITNSGRYEGLAGISTFYRDIGELLGAEQDMNAVIATEEAAATDATRDALAELGTFQVVIATRSLALLPGLVRRYAQDYGLSIAACVVDLSDTRRADMGITDDLLASLTERVHEMLREHAPDARLLLNPTGAEVDALRRATHAVVGSDDAAWEKLGIPLVHPRHEDISLTYPSYVRSVIRVRDKLREAKPRPHLLLNKLSYDAEIPFLLDDRDMTASKQMWSRMSLRRREAVR
ncbi:MAG: nitrogenase component 1 [Propioniciclava sp.]|uniref:nitrogenase component 1 n=1 Tax=Propioniciclava sp. TaxID=2038686 RepID=UPI0039E41185